MDDLVAVEPDDDIPLGIEHIRVLKMVRKGAGRPVKLPLKFKHERRVIDKLVAARLVTAGHSGWPGVPGYIITPDGAAAIGEWLQKRRTPPP